MKAWVRIVALSCCLSALAAGMAVAGPHANTDAVIALHITGKVKNFGCAPTQANPTQHCLTVLPASYVVNDQDGIAGIPCSGIGPSCNNSWVWLMVANFDEPEGLAGISLGVDWEMGTTTNPYADMLVSWTRCGDLEFPSAGWPGPGGGNRITWAPQSNCQRRQPSDGKATAVAGWFYVTGYANYLIENATLKVTQNMNVPTPELAVADCDAVESQLPYYAAGSVAWSMGPCVGPDCGCNPYLGPCEPPVAVQSTTWGRIKQIGN
jgi:hypothetical protein